MNTTTHTPEPWNVSAGDPVVIESENAGNQLGFVAMTLPSPELNWDGTEENYANARRIVACVNALARFPDPAKDVAALVNQIASLVEASGDVLAAWEDGNLAEMVRNLGEEARHAATLLARLTDGRPVAK